MKRRAIKLLLFLLVGAFINIAMTLVCVVFTVPALTGSPQEIDAASAWTTYASPQWRKGGSNEASRSGGIAGDLIVIERNYPASYGPILPAVHEVSTLTSGLPQRCFFQSQATPSEQSAPQMTWYGVLWPGFAINTIFYAAIVWFLFAAPFAIRRRLRRKRGQCAACGYSLRGIGSEQCPECGATTPSPSGRGPG